MSALYSKNVKGKCSNILPNANFINTVSNPQYLNLRQWVRQQINPIAKSPEGKKQQRKQAKEIADNGYLVFMWDKFFATSSHSFCSVTLGALSELWLKCLNIAIWITLPGVSVWEEFLTSQEHPQLSHRTPQQGWGLCLSRVGQVTLVGSKPSSWARWMCCLSSFVLQPTGHRDTLMATPAGPLLAQSHSTHIKIQQFLTGWHWGWFQLSPCLLNKLLKQFGCGNRVALVCRKGTRQWGQCPGQTEHGAFGAIPDSLVSAAWQDMMAFPATVFPQTDLFPLKHHYLQESLPTWQMGDLPALI